MVERVLRWAGPVGVALVMLRVTQLASQPLSNGDTWFHLRLGQELGAPQDWREVEHWSSFATCDWIPTQPLPELVGAWVEDHLGLPGVAWLYGFGLLAFLLTVFAVCRSWAGSLPAGVVTGLTLVAAAGSLSARPQLISLILIPIVVHVWLRTEDDLVPRWWLIPLTWVWAMCHGFWLVGVMVGGCIAVGLIARGQVRGRAGLALLAVPVASFAAAAVTPLGPQLVLAPLAVNQRADLITEWQRTSFLTPQPWPAVLMVLGSVAILMMNGDLSLGRGLMMVMAAGWLVLSVRTVDVAAVVAAPLLATALQSVMTSRSEPARREMTLLGALAACLLVVLALVAPHTADEPGKVPSALDAQLDALPEGTTIINASALGGWLALQHQQLNVVVDGLFDAYPVSHLKQVRDAISARPGWQEFVHESDAQAALIDGDAPLVVALGADGWSRAGEVESPQRRR
jgi:hypothetical protein